MFAARVLLGVASVGVVAGVHLAIECFRLHVGVAVVVRGHRCKEEPRVEVDRVVTRRYIAVTTPVVLALMRREGGATEGGVGLNSDRPTARIAVSCVLTAHVLSTPFEVDSNRILRQMTQCL